MDLSKYLEGATTQEEIQAAIAKAQADVDAEMSAQQDKLKEFRNTNIDAMKAKDEATAKLAEAEAKAKKAEEERIKAQGTAEELKEFYQKESQGKVDSLTAELNQFKERDLKKSRELSIKALGQKGIDAEEFEFMVSSLVSTEFNDKGEIAKTFRGRDGAIVGTTEEEFLAYAVKDAVLSKHVKGNESSGGGALGGKGNRGGAQKLSEMTATEEARFANENPEAYRNMIGA